MPILVCDNCNIYYEISKKEELKDLNTCKCGNRLKYYNSVDDYINKSAELQNEQNLDITVKSSENGINKKIIGFAAFSFIFLIAALFTSAFISAGLFSPTYHYDDFGAHFNFPKEWKIAKEEHHGLKDIETGFTFIYLWDPTDPKRSTTFTYARYDDSLANMGYSSHYDIFNKTKPHGAEIVSNKTTTLRGYPVYELEFQENTSYGIIMGKMIVDTGGDYAYVYKAPKERYPAIKEKFDMIINSWEW